MSEQRARRLEIVNGWLVESVNYCTCYGGDAPYGHEPGCGYEPLENLQEQIEEILVEERKKILARVEEFIQGLAGIQIKHSAKLIMGGEFE